MAAIEHDVCHPESAERRRPCGLIVASWSDINPDREAMETFGYSAKTWQEAKDQIRAVLVDCARRQKTIAYSDLVPKIPAIDLQAHDPRLDELLEQISTEETGHGRGMLAVLVVHKAGDQRPGRGFYSCAEQLGLDVTDQERLWVDQFNKVLASWAQR
jgi:hypothetical protein